MAKENHELAFGVSSWLWGDDDLIEGIPILGEFGIHNVEMSCLSPVVRSHDEQFLSDLKQCISANDLQVCQTHPDGDRFDLSVDREIDGKKPVEHLKDWITDFAGFNRPVLVSHTSELFSVKEDRRSRLDICRKNILEVVAFCEQSGTRLALETIWNFTEQTGEESSLGETEEEFLEIVNFSDSECLGIHIDTGHSHLLGNLMRIVELAGDRLFSLHIHDNHGQREGGHWDEHLIPGEGDIDWERLLSTLASVNYNGALVVEVPPKGPVESRLEEIQRWMQWVQQRSTQS